MVLSTSSIDTIATVLYHAQVFNPRRSKQALPPDFNQLLKAVERLFEALDSSGGPYLLVGGIAMLTYVDGRNTEDIDLIMRRSDLSNLEQLVIAAEERDFVHADYQGLQVQLLLTQNPLFEQVQRDYQTEIEWGSYRIPCATPLGLVILKLYALPSLYRQGNLGRVGLYETDILQLVYNYNIALQPAILMLEPHLSANDCSVVRDLAREIEQRLQRMLRSAHVFSTPDAQLEP